MKKCNFGINCFFATATILFIDLPKITIDFRLAILGQLLLRRGTNEIMAIYDRFDHVDRH